MTDTASAEVTTPVAAVIVNTWGSLSKDVLYTTGPDVNRSQADYARDMLRTRQHSLTNELVAKFLSDKYLCSRLINTLKDRPKISVLADPSNVEVPDIPL